MSEVVTSGLYQCRFVPLSCQPPQAILTKGRVGTVDLLIKVACFVKEFNNIFNIKKELI
jgi:hypothetical protein